MLPPILHYPTLMQEIGIFQVIHTAFIAPFMVINIRMVIFCRPVPIAWQNSANYVALLCQTDGITLPTYWQS